MKPNTLKTIIAAFILGLGAASAATPDDGSVLPFCAGRRSGHESVPSRR
jgi:hypothetical protein